ncbi:hypothetical protein AAC387_Pa06g2211 [Persea americana]
MYIFFSLPPPPAPPPPVATDSPAPDGSPSVNRTQGTGNKDTSKTIIMVVSIVVIVIILSTICVWLLLKKKKKNKRKSGTTYEEEAEIKIDESFSFDLSTLRAATNNFSTDNKLGEGGFGPVYKDTIKSNKLQLVNDGSGYMAPEYVIHGQYSIQSDVFSFGVLVLEIITGRKNLSFTENEDTTNLLSYAWQHWNEGTSLEIIDQSIAGHHSTNEILRCLHMGLLCVQDDATQRLTMSSVVLMLNSTSVTFPVPSPPAFYAVAGEAPADSIGGEFSKQFLFHFTLLDIEMGGQGGEG